MKFIWFKFSFSTSGFAVLYGSSTTITGIPLGQTIQVQTATMHENYNSRTFANDIGVLKLAVSKKLDKRIINSSWAYIFGRIV